MPRKSKHKQYYAIHPDTRREIVMVFLFTAAALALLSYFDLGGQAGKLLDRALAGILGTFRPLIPVALVGAGALLSGRRPRGAAIFGIVLGVAAISALVHLTQFPGEAGLKAVEQGQGGGYVGLFLAYPLWQLFGFWAAGVILVAILLTALSLMLERPLSWLITSSSALLRVLGQSGVFLGRLLRRPKIYGEYAQGSVQQELQFEEHVIESEISDKKSEVGIEIRDGENGMSKSSATDFRLPTTDFKSKKRIRWVELPLDLLDKNGSKPISGDIRQRQEIIEKTFKNFGIAVDMGDVSVGPTVTQYTLRPAQGVKLSSIVALANDLALALAAHPIRIEAPIPGKSLVGIEVPNEQVAMVRLREVLESAEWQKRGSPLTVVVGRDVTGKPWLADLARMPHLLVAGSTGSGKTVCLNTIILSLLYQNSPDDLKFLLIDPKRVELPSYNGIPHLMAPVVTEVKATVQALRFAIMEMERRFARLSSCGARDIRAFNEGRAPEERMAYLIIIVDELADLMVAAASEVEASIIRLAQMARAVGIHLILATQRPSVDVITGLIKANITSRIAFSVAALVDSRTILDTAGAEKLLGRGDMLFVTAELGKPKRLQGAYVSDQEIKRVVEHLKKSGEPQYVELTVKGSSADSGEGSTTGQEDDDPLIPEAKEVILRAGKASASLLQRRLKVGYARAARLLDLLEAEGFIGPGEGAKPREILAPEE